MTSPRSLFLLLTATLLWVPQLARSQDATGPAPAPGSARPASPNPRWVVPKDTTIPLRLQNTVNSRTAYVGQAIYCETVYPITVDDRILIPVGSYVKGAVAQVVRPGRIKGKAQLGLRFTSITLPNGTTRLLRATLSAFAGNENQGFRRDESKVEGESTKGQDAANVGVSAGQGAIIGGLAGRSAKGVGIGAATGGVGGLILVLATRGREILLPSGTSLELQLAAPLSFERHELDSAWDYPEGPALPRREFPPGF